MNTKILFLGDLFYDFDKIQKDIECLSAWIKENNFITVLNLESPIGTGIGEAIKKRGPNLASNPIVVDVLKKLNTVGVCLANNHMMDFGESALNNTILTLDKNGIAHAGAGCNLESALKPINIYIDDLKISILNFGWDIEETIYATENTAGCAPRVEEYILNAIDETKQVSDRVIVCMHWGFEYNRLPMPFDIDLAHKMLDAGAELIVGHHPHCVQPKEIYNGKHIYYSLGNFYFGGRRDRYTKKFHERIKNQSDYGGMVSYDPSRKMFAEYFIYYDHDKDESVRTKCESSLVLEDISGIDCNSKVYFTAVKRRKVNINPILTLDKKKNKKLLRSLFSIYILKEYVKAILRR